MDLISVIIPYFKKRKYILTAIKSALNQTYKKIEILIIYDDEDQIDLDYIKSIKRLDNRIRLIINKKNIGAGYSRNKGIKKSKGVYLAFLDADDFWKKDKLKKQLAFMKKNSVNISHTSYKIIDKNDRITGERKAKMTLNHTSLLKDCEIGLSTVMIKKTFLPKKIKFPNLKTKEDFVLWLNLTKYSNIYGLKNFLCFWRNTDDSLSKNTMQKVLDGFRVYKIHMNFSFLKSIYYLFLLSINYIKKTV